MPVETQLRKRPALHKGEVGLFPQSEMAEEDIRPLSNNADYLCKVSSPKNLALLAKLWCIADVLAKSDDRFFDREDAMDFLKVKARFIRNKLNPRTGELEIVGKSLARCTNETLSRLADRMTYIVCNNILPGMKESDLKKELERMVG